MPHKLLKEKALNERLTKENDRLRRRLEAELGAGEAQGALDESKLVAVAELSECIASSIYASTRDARRVSKVLEDQMEEESVRTEKRNDGKLPAVAEKDTKGKDEEREEEEEPPPLALDRATFFLRKATTAAAKLSEALSARTSASASAVAAKIKARVALRNLRAGDLVLLQPRKAKGSACEAAATSFGPVVEGDGKAYALSPSCNELVKGFRRVEGAAGLRLGRIVLVEVNGDGNNPEVLLHVCAV